LFQNGIVCFVNAKLYYSTILPKQIQHIICVNYVQHESCDNERKANYFSQITKPRSYFPKTLQVGYIL
jgi:hypothetical protein